LTSTSTAAPPAIAASALTAARQRATDFARRMAVAPSSYKATEAAAEAPPAKAATAAQPAAAAEDFKGQ
jgi:hypothetical protein